MNASLTSIALSLAGVILCILGIIFIVVRKQSVEYKLLAFYLGCRSGFEVLLLLLILIAGRGLNERLLYELYFYTYNLAFASESVLGLLLIYSIFNLAMAPLEGIKKLGTLIFRWAASISAALALVAALAPHLSQSMLIVDLSNELQRTQDILTFCLLVFVCFAIRPMGLSYSSRIFGVSLGLAILSIVDLAGNTLTAHYQQMYSVIDTATGVSACAVFLLWIAYFALPEPKRRIIVLPTTSPFLRWNQISQVLGDEPGFVAIGGIPPELFAPAEIEIMRRASLQMANQPVVTMQPSQTL